MTHSTAGHATASTKATTGPQAAEPVSLGDLTRVFARIGLLSFGGPAAQIALMHKELVEDRPWLTEAEYLRALSFCMLLPGPEAMQLATYCGWRLHGTAGGLIAGLLFVAPGAVIVMALAMVFASFGQVPFVEAMFFGVQAAVLAIVLHALLRVAKKALHAPWQWVLAVAAFLALFLFNIPFPVVILAAAAAGWWIARGLPLPERAPSAPGMIAEARRQALIWGAVWLTPLAVLGLAEGGLLFDLGVFFSQLAVLTFGGAYAVLAWMTQAVVQEHGWLTTDEMMTGLGLAETKPGPLILVNQFVGYLAGFRQGGVLLGVGGALVALWMTFAPCFLWIFAGAPFVERLAKAPRLSSALVGITAAVVGVIANLSVWFAVHVLFDEVGSLSAGPLQVVAPVLASLNFYALAIGALAMVLVFRLHWSIPAVLAVSAALSLGLSLL